MTPVRADAEMRGLNEVRDGCLEARYDKDAS